MADTLYTMNSSTSLFLTGRYAERLWCVSPGWENLRLARYNNLESATHQNGVVSGKTDFHVDISKSPRGEFLFPR